MSNFKMGFIAYAKAFAIAVVVYLVMSLFWPPGDSLSWTDWFQEWVPLLITTVLGDYFYRRAVEESQ